MKTKVRRFKIGAQYITEPNMIGELVRETPRMFVLKITKRTFEPKSSATFTHKFKANEREFYSKCFPYEKRFWKETGIEVGGTSMIIKEMK